MKTAFYFTLFLAFALSFYSCDKEDGPDAIIEDDPCQFLDCLNDGYCEDGNCVCINGWAGFNCTTEIPPTSMYIKEVRALTFTTQNGQGVPWDSGSGPDIYFKVFGSEGQIYEEILTIHYGGISGTSTGYPWVLEDSIVLDSPLTEYTIVLYDYDEETEDQLIGSCDFIPYPAGLQFPDSNVVFNTIGNTSFRLFYGYTW